jgi:hypothetical protein
MNDEATQPDDPSQESLAEMPEVHDWSRAQPNPYAARLGVRHLPADLAKAFPDDAAVANALRSYLKGKG